MAFILTKDRPENSYEEWQSAWSAYSNYLSSIRDQLPKGAYEFAIASWHYNFEDHRSPHDGWLETLVIQERAIAERTEQRAVEMTILLKAANHDGTIEIKYVVVESYSLTKAFEGNGQDGGGSGHQDWLYDEVRLSEQGNVLHEIEWSGGSRWLIESKEIIYNWRPYV